MKRDDYSRPPPERRRHDSPFSSPKVLLGLLLAILLWLVLGLTAWWYFWA